MSAVLEHRYVNSRSAGVFDDRDLSQESSFFAGEGDRIAMRARGDDRIAFDKRMLGKYRFQVKPNYEIIETEHDETDVVLPVAGAFQQRVIGKKSINTLQEWEGYVSSIGKSSFEAVLADITDRTRANEKATIPLSAVSKEEKKHLKCGAIFRLIVGVAVTENGNRINDQIIYFRRYIPVSHRRETFSSLVRAVS